MGKLVEIRNGQTIYDVVSNYDNVLAMMAQNGLTAAEYNGKFVIDEELNKANPVDIKKAPTPEQFEQIVFDNQNIYDLIFQSTNDYDNVLSFMVKNGVQKTDILPKKIIFAKSEIRDKFKYQRDIRPATGIISQGGISVWEINTTFIVGSKV